MILVTNNVTRIEVYDTAKMEGRMPKSHLPTPQSLLSYVTKSKICNFSFFPAQKHIFCPLKSDSRAFSHNYDALNLLKPTKIRFFTRFYFDSSELMRSGSQKICKYSSKNRILHIFLFLPYEHRKKRVKQMYYKQKKRRLPPLFISWKESRPAIL